MLMALLPPDGGSPHYTCSGVALSMGVDRALLIALESEVARSATTALVLRTFHCERLSTVPPAIATGCRSLSLPSIVPWYRDSSALLLCFFLIASPRQ